MAQVRYKVDISRVLKRLAEVKKVGADGIRELTLEYAKRAASKAIRTTPPNSLKNCAGYWRGSVGNGCEAEAR